MFALRHATGVPKIPHTANTASNNDFHNILFKFKKAIPYTVTIIRGKKETNYRKLVSVQISESDNRIAALHFEIKVPAISYLLTNKQKQTN
jgi:hypothetical protein